MISLCPLSPNIATWVSPSHMIYPKITLVEQVQRRFTKRLHGYSGYSYEKRLQTVVKSTKVGNSQNMVWSDLVLQNCIWYSARYPDQFIGWALPGTTLSSCISAITPAGLDHYFSLKESPIRGINSRFLSLTLEVRTLPSFKKSLHRIDLTYLLADAWLLASIIQGSAIRPASFVVGAADLKAVTPGNLLVKFADDTHIVIPAVNCSSRQVELQNVAQWPGTTISRQIRPKWLRLFSWTIGRRKRLTHRRHFLASFVLLP